MTYHLNTINQIRILLFGGRITIKKVVGIFVCTLMIFTILPVTADMSANRIYNSTNFGNTLYVGGIGPNNYTMIQDAIDDANYGDTIFVYDDSSPYYGNLIVDKSVFLIGEDKHTTIIDGSGHRGDVLDIIIGDVSISGFSIRNGSVNPDPYGAGVSVNSDYVTITDNIIYDNYRYGVEVRKSEYCHIKGNIISDNHEGICISYSNSILVEDNIIEKNSYAGIGVYNSYSGITRILNNTIINNNDYGLYIHNILHCSIIINQNIISENKVGIINGAGSNCHLNHYFCSIFENVIKSNSIYGIYLMETNGNLIYKNNFIDNKINAYLYYYGLQNIGFNKWNLLLKGNYWDDMTGSGSKIIQGEIFFLKPALQNISLQWFNIDFFPAREPYDL